MGAELPADLKAQREKSGPCMVGVFAEEEPEEFDK
jgi:hypothetical protein